MEFENNSKSKEIIHAIQKYLLNITNHLDEDKNIEIINKKIMELNVNDDNLKDLLLKFLNVIKLLIKNKNDTHQRICSHENIDNTKEINKNIQKENENNFNNSINKIIDDIKLLSSLIDNKVNKEEFIIQINLISKSIEDYSDKINKHIELLYNENKEKVEKINNLEKEVTDLKEENKTQSIQINDLKEENKTQSIQINDLIDENKTKSIQINDLIEEIKTKSLQISENNINIYDLKNLVSSLVEQNKKMNKHINQLKKSYNKKLKNEVDDQITSYSIERNMAFIENRDNFKSLILILLIANDYTFEQIESQRNKLIKELISKKYRNHDKLFNFINSVNDNLNYWNKDAHSGYKNDIMINLFNLMGKSNEYEKIYSYYFNDNLIKSAIKFMNNLNESKMSKTEFNMEKEFVTLKNMIPSELTTLLRDTC